LRTMEDFLRPGDLVTNAVVENHGGRCHRLYDMLPEQQVIEVGRIVLSRVIDKLWHGEVGLVVEVSGDRVLVLTSRGKQGWIKSALLRAHRAYGVQQ
jgi:hypothetical protein